jgi:lipoprotein-anchoring transpeptidase ErfK/SrfK
MRRRLLVAAGLALTLGGTAASAGGAYAYFWDRSNADVIATGVTIAGVDVGSLRAVQARALLDARLVRPLERPVRVAHSFVFSPTAAGLETPAGLYAINDKQVDPSWHVPTSPWAGDLAGRIIPPGPQDPIKARWLGFWDGAGIHGTEDVGSIGSAASHGCIRMTIPDVEALYPLVPLHTPIYVG